MKYYTLDSNFYIINNKIYFFVYKNTHLNAKITQIFVIFI